MATGGKLRTEPTPELAQFISVVATGNVSATDVDAFLAGLLAVRPRDGRLVDDPGIEALPRFTALGRGEYEGDGDLLNDDDADNATVGAPFTWSTLNFFSPGRHEKVCADFHRGNVPRTMPSPQSPRPDGLAEGIETLWPMLKEAAAHVIENDPRWRPCWATPPASPPWPKPSSCASPARRTTLRLRRSVHPRICSSPVTMASCGW